MEDWWETEGRIKEGQGMLLKGNTNLVGMFAGLCDESLEKQLSSAMSLAGVIQRM